MTALSLLLGACAYDVELRDTGLRRWERPVLELSTHEVVGPTGSPGVPADWNFSLQLRNPGGGRLRFETPAITASGARMCLEAGSVRCGDEVEPPDTGRPDVRDTGGAPPCEPSLDLPELRAGCAQDVYVAVHADAPLGLLQVAAEGGPWGEERVGTESAPGPARDFRQEVVVRPYDAWSASPRLRLAAAAVQLPFAASGQAEVAWELQNVGSAPATLTAVEPDCAAYTALAAPIGVPVPPGDSAELRGTWTYGTGATTCTLTLRSDADPVEARVRVLPEPWAGLPELQIATPAAGALLDPGADLVVTATLGDPQSARSWSATLRDADDDWEQTAARVGPGTLRFTVPAWTIGAGARTLQVRADDGQRAVVATVPVVLGAAAGLDGDGRSVADGDCDDSDATTYPGAAELADGLDNDCDGVVDEGTPDFDDDGDGLSEAAGDRDDADADAYPDAPEACDGKDNDGDDVVDEGTLCGDDDGDGLSEQEGDCDDADAARHPGTADRCGVDDNCDGLTGACGWAGELVVLGLGVDDDVCVAGEPVAVELYAVGHVGALWDWLPGSVDGDALDTELADTLCPQFEGEPTRVTLGAAVAGVNGDWGWAEGELIALPPGYDLDAPAEHGGAGAPACGCEAMSPLAAGLAGIGLLGWARRQRRRR